MRRVGLHNCALQLPKLRLIRRADGFTLIEIIVSFAILALISVSVLSAVMGMAGIQQRDNQLRQDNSTVEGSIASGANPFETKNGLELSLGGYPIISAAETHSTGIGSYTVLNPGTVTPPPDFILDGSDGHYMPYTIPLTGYYKLEAWGAKGGDGEETTSSGSSVVYTAPGGSGGYSAGTVLLQKGVDVHVHAGTVGSSGTPKAVLLGGEFGGGEALRNTAANNQRTHLHGAGGGASDIRINTDSLTARIIVAGGGGGSGGSYAAGYTIAGGYAGGVQGQTPGSTPDNRTSGGGGTQSSGGSGGSYSAGAGLGGNGTFGYGGVSGVLSTNFFDAGGGGGGWYGGGGGGAAGPAGGGGSGWVFTQSAYNAWTNTAEKSSYLLDSSYWLSSTTLTSANATMPNPRSSGALMTGMADYGYVRVSWVGTSL